MKCGSPKEQQTQASAFGHPASLPVFRAPASLFPMKLWLRRPTLWPEPSFPKVFYFNVSVDMNHVPVNWNLSCQISQCAGSLQVHKTTFVSASRKTWINSFLWGFSLSFLSPHPSLSMTSSVKSRVKRCEKSQALQAHCTGLRLETLW